MALLATQRALLGGVTPELRAVVIDVCKKEKLLYMCFYYEGEISSEENLDLKLYYSRKAHILPD